MSPEVARLLSPETSDIIRLRAVHGQMALSETDQVMLWFLVLSGDSSRELKNEALTALRQATPAGLKPVLKDRTLHPRVLDFLLRARYNDLPVVIFLRSNPSVPQRSWLAIFQRCSYEILSFFFSDQAPFKLSNDELKAARSNPQTTEVLQAHIDQQLSIAAHFEALAAQERNGQVEANEEGESGTESLAEEDFADHEEEYDELRTASKQQIAMELSVSEKVKMAMTGDKEWRSIMLKDSNKQISSAVLANPRISEGEVLQLAQNRSTSEELIRLILLNREWLKNYPIRLALTQHPRTPISQAMRFLSTLSEKDLRILSKSRNISSVIVNNCRRMLAAKTKH